MSGPALVVLDEDPAALRDVAGELHDRYARHYRVVSAESRDEALARLEELAQAGVSVALILSGPLSSGTICSEFLDTARRLHPQAKRGLVIPWGAWGHPDTGEMIFDSVAHGRIDAYVLRPAEPPDELFHQAISGLLLEWAEAQRTSPYTIFVVGASWSGRAYELRDALHRCAIPHAFRLAESTEGRDLLDRAGPAAKLPLVAFPDGTILADPSDGELASAAGSPIHPERMDFDLVIVGAGPAGLSAAVYGASEGFTTLVADQGGIGGQATSSSLIRNYLGFPRGLSGRRLARYAYDQAWVFGANFVFMQPATGIRRADDRLVLSLSKGEVRTRAVLLATGAEYRRLGVPELEQLQGAGVFYGGPASEAPTTAGEDVYVLGGANAAAQAALHLAAWARRVTLVVRAQSLGAGMSHYLIRQLEATPNLHVRLRTEIVGGGGEGYLDWLVLRDRATGKEERVEADELFLMIGARPHTEWLPEEIARDHRGFVLTGADLPDDHDWPLDREPLLMETGMPGVFAAGDVRHGSVKRVASAVGDGSIAIQQLHRLFAADRLHPRGRPKEPAAAP